MKKTKYEYQFDIQYIRLARYISALLIVMYAIVPVLVDFFSLYEAKYAAANFWFSVALLAFMFTLPSKVTYLKNPFGFTEKRNFALTVIIFLAASCVFYLFPWHDDRESIGASVSAFFRALWFVVSVSYLNTSERNRLLVVIATIILMYIDQSRTYFLLLLIIIAARSNYKKSALVAGLLLAIVLGAVRSSDSAGGLDLLLYGIVGEGYNATKAVGQIYEVSNIPIDSFYHISSTILQPITLPFDVVLSKIFAEDYRLQDYYLAELVSSNLGEVFNPMGGWYITGDFIYYGYYGVFIMWIYLYITWLFSRALLDTNSFPYGAFFIFIAIKSTPFVYWKFVLYILIVSFIYKHLASFRFCTKKSKIKTLN